MQFILHGEPEVNLYYRQCLQHLEASLQKLAGSDPISGLLKTTLSESREGLQPSSRHVLATDQIASKQASQNDGRDRDAILEASSREPGEIASSSLQGQAEEAGDSDEGEDMDLDPIDEDGIGLLAEDIPPLPPDSPRSASPN